MSERNVSVASLAALSIKDESEPGQRYLKELERKAEDILVKAGGSVGSTMMPEKKRDVSLKNAKAETLNTNVFGVVMKENVSVYRYQVKIEGIIMRNGKEDFIEFSKKHSKDAFTVDRRDRCFAVYSAFRLLPDCPFRQSRCVYYDLQSILFSLDRLQLKKDKYRILNESIGEETYRDFRGYAVSLTSTDDGTTLQLGDMRGLSFDLDEVHRTLAQFLDIATAQQSLQNREDHVTFNAGLSYLMDPLKAGFRPNDSTFFDQEKSYLAIGCDKAIRYIEGPGNRPSACSASLVIHTKKTPFHAFGPVIDKALCYIPMNRLSNIREDDRATLENYLKGFVVEATHSRKRQMFVIDGISRDSAQSLKISVKSDMVTIEQYYTQTYNIQLKHSDFPLIVSGRGERARYFPMELCNISDNQRVKPNQESGRMKADIIKLCAIPPEELYRQTNLNLKSLNLANDEHLKAANISVTNTPISVSALQIKPPRISIGKRVMEVNNYSWRQSGFIEPKAEKWAYFTFLNRDENRKLTEQQMNLFLDLFVKKCNENGMPLGPPSAKDRRSDNKKDIQSTFEALRKDGIIYVLIIHNDEAPLPHAEIKYAERMFCVVSQCVKMSTVLKAARDPMKVSLTMQNIVNKANIKFGGLNYVIDPEDPRAADVLSEDTLFIGLGSNHPGGGLGMSTPSNSGPSSETGSDSPGGSGDAKFDERRPPTVIGYSANIGYNGPFDFAGDFSFQEPSRQENVEVISEIVSRCIKRFETVKGYQPKRIFVYRGGCSEGQFRMMLKYEVPLIKVSLKTMNCQASLTVIAVNKLQNVRFFSSNINPSDKVPAKNIQPGIVVDRGVTHPLFAEFFLNSHRAVQGTVRTPKYVVIYDDNNMQMSQLQEISYILAYGHQIIFSPVSLPAPVYIANKYADRGRALYQRWIDDGGVQENYRQLTDSLCYFSKELFPDELYGFRVNA